MIQIKVFHATSASEIETKVNSWIQENCESVAIVRIGDCLPKGASNTGLYLTLVYSTNADKLFS